MTNLYIVDYRTQRTFHLNAADSDTADKIYNLCCLDDYDFYFTYSLEEAEEVGYPIKEIDSYV